MTWNLYQLAKEGKLDQVPDALLTIKVMTKKNKDGIAPLHYAALAGHIAQVPKRIITVETMLLNCNWGGFTPLQGAQMYGQLDLLLGIDFGDRKEAKEIVGEEWWAKNLEVLKTKNGLEMCDAAPEVDIF